MPAEVPLRLQALGATLILAHVGLTALVAAGVEVVLRSAGLLPAHLALPTALRFAGLVVVGLGLLAVILTLRVRPPAVMLRSTAVTLVKILRRTPREHPEGRTEPFVATGPYRFVRNPLYLGVILAVLGWGLWAASSTALLWSAVLALWFGLVLVPAEEREMVALFGQDYARYRAAVPMLVPRWRPWAGR